MTCLKRLITRIRLAYLGLRLRAVDARQRAVVANMIYAADCRMYAAAEYSQRSLENAMRKRRLLAKMEAVGGEKKND